MPRGGAGCGHSEGSAGRETNRPIREQQAEAAAGQHAGAEPDGAEEGWGGKVRDQTQIQDTHTNINLSLIINTHLAFEALKSQLVFSQ